RVHSLAPGGDRQRGGFDTVENGRVRNAFGLGGKVASKIVLPALPNVDAKGTPLTAQTALRGQPRRTYVPATNGG
ncbi:MAG: hypothetical protein ACKOB2_08300, partial [Solirubrobacterales bacterium]